MNMVLEKNMTWPELCEYTFSRISHKLKAKEHQKFKDWFMERESVGYRFDPVMIMRCFRIWKDLQDGLDHFVVVSGREGLGKTTFSLEIAAWVYPGMTLDNVVYGARDYVRVLSKKANEVYESQKTDKEKPKTEAVILDEGTELMSRESLNLSNRILSKTFFVQRALRYLVIVNIPNFHMLDSVVRAHRVRTLIELLARGKYKAITGKGIKIICKEGQATKDIRGIRIPDGTFWTGYFVRDFPKGIDREEYEEHKLRSIVELMEELKDDTVSRKMIAAVRAAKEIGSQSDTVIRLIKKGEIEGKRIGGKWYLTRKAYDKLLTP